MAGLIVGIATVAAQQGFNCESRRNEDARLKSLKRLFSVSVQASASGSVFELKIPSCKADAVERNLAEADLLLKFAKRHSKQLI